MTPQNPHLQRSKRTLPDNFNTAGTDIGRAAFPQQPRGLLATYGAPDPETQEQASSSDLEFPNAYRVLDELTEKLTMLDHQIMLLRDRLGPVIEHDPKTTDCTEFPEALRGFELRTPLDHRIGDAHNVVDCIIRSVRRLHGVLAL